MKKRRRRRCDGAKSMVSGGDDATLSGEAEATLKRQRGGEMDEFAREELGMNLIDLNSVLTWLGYAVHKCTE